MDFKITSKLKPKGDQPQAIKKLVAGLHKGYHDQTLLGVTGSGKSVVFDTPVLIKRHETITSEFIGEFIDEAFYAFRDKIKQIGNSEILALKNLPEQYTVKTYSLNPITKQTAWKTVTCITRHHSPRTLYKVKTSCGREVTITGNHNFFVIDNGELQLKETRQLHQGEYIPLPYHLEPSPKNNLALNLTSLFSNRDKIFISAPHFLTAFKNNKKKFRAVIGPAKIHNIMHNNERMSLQLYNKLIAIAPELGLKAKIGVFHRDYQLPITLPLTNTLLRFFGYYIAEGHAENKYLIISSGDPEIITDFTCVLDHLKINWRRRPKTYDYQISSSLWSQILSHYCGQNSKTKHFPFFWPQLDNRRLSNFLSAYFSTDGGVDGQAITCTTASKELASDISMALLKFNIVARIRKKRVKPSSNNKGGIYWVISISGRDHLTTFQKKIGFQIKHKQKRLSNIIPSQGNTNVDLIPIKGKWLINMRQRLQLSQKNIADHCDLARSHISLIEHEKRKPSRTAYTKIIALLKKYAVKNNQYRLIKDIDDKKNLLNVYWSPIKSIKKIPGEKYVYDFTVKDNETFLAGYGGMFVHNTFTMANIIQQVKKPALVISHNKTLAAQLASEFQDFFPDNAVHYFVSYYDYYQPEAYIPRTDTYIEKESQLNEEIDRLRHASTQAILSRDDVIIVASVSCIYSLGSPAEYKSDVITLKVGQKEKREKVLASLVNIHYQRNQMDLWRNRFRVLGDVVEVFPSFSENNFYRLQFYGDEIEKIVEVDSLTNSKIADLKEVDIYPARHYLAPEEVMKVALQEIEHDLEKQVAKFKKENKLIEAQRLEQRTRYDLEMIKEVGYCNGIENYSRYFDRRKPGQPPYTLMDFFPKDYLVFIDESHMTVPQIRGMYFGDRSRKETLIEFGFRLPSALDNRPLNFAEFENHLNQVAYISATPDLYERTRSRQIVEQLVRPTGLLDPTIKIRPTENQIDDLIAEIKKTVDKKQRVLVTTLTKRMAEDLTDYLADLDIKVQYLHSEVETFERLEILRDLRLGKYDVVVGINLLREGLDLPEVSLIAILDADKEGYLRSDTALIQTMGRAARHVEGHIIMYADKITGSMQRAIDETSRRRRVQEKYNKEHKITPTSIKKAIKESRLAGAKAKEPEKPQLPFKDIPKEELPHLIADLENQMEIAAKNLEFEKAAMLRDEISALKKASAKKRK